MLIINCSDPGDRDFNFVLIILLIFELQLNRPISYPQHNAKSPTAQWSIHQSPESSGHPSRHRDGPPLWSAKDILSAEITSLDLKTAVRPVPTDGT